MTTKDKNWIYYNGWCKHKDVPLKFFVYLFLIWFSFVWIVYVLKNYIF